MAQPCHGDAIAERAAGRESRERSDPEGVEASRRWSIKTLGNEKRTCAREQIMYIVNVWAGESRVAKRAPAVREGRRIDDTADSSGGGRRKRGQDQGPRRRSVAD